MQRIPNEHIIVKKLNFDLHIYKNHSLLVFRKMKKIETQRYKDFLGNFDFFFLSTEYKSFLFCLQNNA